MKGGRALYLWPAVFVGVMLIGGGFGMVHIGLPFVELAILASVVALGLCVALAVDVPLTAGAADAKAIGEFGWLGVGKAYEMDKGHFFWVGEFSGTSFPSLRGPRSTPVMEW